ncbi:hypothetical protein K443DRAFT_108542, partial [Laccaria amethystina LaAM-08-1]
DYSEMRINVVNFGFYILKLNPCDITWFKTNTNNFTTKLFVHVKCLVIYFVNIGFCILKLNPCDTTWFKTNTNSFTMQTVKVFAHVECLVIYFGKNKDFYVTLPLLVQMTQFFFQYALLICGIILKGQQMYININK